MKTAPGDRRNPAAIQIRVPVFSSITAAGSPGRHARVSGRRHSPYLPMHGPATQCGSKPMNPRLEWLRRTITQSGSALTVTGKSLVRESLAAQPTPLRCSYLHWKTWLASTEISLPCAESISRAQDAASNDRAASRAVDEPLRRLLLPQLQSHRSQEDRRPRRRLCLYGENRTLTWFRGLLDYQ